MLSPPSKVILRNLTFHHKGSGRAVFINDATFVKFENCNFIHSGHFDGDGGAVEVRGANAKVVFESCTFTGNVGKYGGALAVDESLVELIESVFDNNKASLGGGAIAISNKGE